ncbi:MAG: malic enzyme, partial [Kingella sp. (in: b-proteobacteria)]
DCGASEINEAMKKAAVYAIADLAHEPVPEAVRAAYQNRDFTFGAEYLIPTPFDPRLISRIAPAVAKAAAESGVAARPIADLSAYAASLEKK